MSIAGIILVISGLLLSVITGVFVDFSITIVPSLREMQPKEHILAMQIINRKIINLPFITSFMGLAVLLPITTYLHRDTVQFPFLIVASALYIIGNIIITIGGNIPLNDQLDTVVSETLTETEAEQIRSDYHGIGSRWMRLHNFRTLIVITTTVLILVSGTL